MLISKLLFVGLGGLGVFFSGLGFFLGFSPFIRNFIKEEITSQTRLEKGTEQYERWEKLPFPLLFNVYIFNVSNPEEIVEEGAKPKVKEVGPFVYKQYFHKQNIEYSKDNDTYSYKQYVKLEFDRSKSAYGEDDKFTVLNLPLQGVFQNEEEGILPANIQALGVNLLWSLAFDGDGIFVTLTAKQLFFDGYEFCRIKDENADEEDRGLLDQILDQVTSLPKKTFCSQVRTVTATNPAIIDDEKKLRFSFFSHKNGHADGAYEVSAGQKDIHSLGEIKHWEHMDHMKIWNDEDSLCNRIRGTDSAIYPPFNNDSAIFNIYNTDICRVITLTTREKIVYQEIEGIKATMGAENLFNGGNRSCYCVNRTRNLDGELGCLPKGLADLYNCMHAPVILSFPHLMWADERYRNTVEGLKPDESKHTSFVALEPNTGTPLQGRKRVQFNMIIRPIDPISITESITPSLMPVIWVEEVFDLPTDLADHLKHEFLDKMVLLDSVTFLMIGTGITCIVVSVAFFVFPLF